MPELPEVHTISQDLNKHIAGFTIKNIQISKNYKMPKSEITKLKSIIDSKIISADKLAKNIILKLSNNLFLMFHLAMTGRLLLRKSGDKNDNWVKIVFELADEEEKYSLRFCDMRQFGKVRVVNKEELEKYSHKYGLDPLDIKTKPEELHRVLSSRKTNLKNALMDQSLIFGLGNIYATDALFLSSLNPKSSTQSLTLEESTKLLKSIKEILNEGIKNRGSTLPDKMYVDIFGKGGNQQNYFKVYGKLKCINCGSKISFEKINGRGTYYCPNCQPLKNINSKTSNSKSENKQKRLF